VKGEEIAGVFIAFRQEEQDSVYAMLKEEGLEESPKGIREFLMRCTVEEPEEPPMPSPSAGIFQFVAEHPQETIMAARQAVAGLDGLLKKMKIKKAG